MPTSEPHVWEFKARFRRHAYGWKSQPAIDRIKQAVSEIKKVARRDPVLAAEGAVLFLERVSPALERIDSSSGAIGTAVTHAIVALVPVISGAHVDAKTRKAWLDRLFQAHRDDEIPYIELLGDYWGELCATPEVAAAWADEHVDILELAWSPDPSLRGHFHGTTACLSALLKAGRHEQILALVEKAPFVMWHWRVWGVRALAAQGRVDDAIRYAEGSLCRNDSPAFAAAECEAILLAAGRAEEAYRDYALVANRAGTNLASYRALAKKYAHIAPATLLTDLVASTPGDEGKWFATAKDLGLFDVAIDLARRSPCDPKTLARAARDHAAEHPGFAIEAGGAALHWLAQGYGYDVTSVDVWAAYRATMQAAEGLGCAEAVKTQLRERVAGGSPGSFVAQVLKRELGL